MRKVLQPGPVARISIGVICLVFSLVLVFDSFLNLLPGRDAQQVEARRLGSQLIGDQIGDVLTSGDQQGLQGLVDRLASSRTGIESIGVRQADMTLVASSAGHAQRWTVPAGGALAPTQVVVPLFRDKARWGEVELVFADRSPRSVTEWLVQPNTMFLLLLSLLGFVVVYFYLRRALHYLDPGYSVPQRVRVAFDTLTEAVLIINTKGQVMLANARFREMAGGSVEQMEGISITQLDWLVAGINDGLGHGAYPWQGVLRSGRTVQGQNVKVTLPDGSRRELIMNCSAISDGSGVARGCLVTFDDVTALSDANARLQGALRELEISRDHIQQQNLELQKHAHFDHLTGCLNRRAFFEQADRVYRSAVASGGPLFCIMTDIDHFKSFNDRFGHSVGDEVIQAVVAAVRRSLRSGDLFCRYGGEEFCILLANTDENSGNEIAERIRVRIKTESGASVNSVSGLRITSSLGVASLMQADGSVPSLTTLIEQADGALYTAKKAGRNRVANTVGQILSGEDPLPQRDEAMATS